MVKEILLRILSKQHEKKIYFSKLNPVSLNLSIFPMDPKKGKLKCKAFYIFFRTINCYSAKKIQVLIFSFQGASRNKNKSNTCIFLMKLCKNFILYFKSEICFHMFSYLIFLTLYLFRYFFSFPFQNNFYETL